MRTQLDMVDQFHRVFSIDRLDCPEGRLEPQAYELRYNLMEEENREYMEACQEGNIVKIADALGDMLYVLCGTIITHGLQEKMEAVFVEIHKSNLSKLGEDGKPVYRDDGKILKSSQFFRPDIASILSETGIPDELSEQE